MSLKLVRPTHAYEDQVMHYKESMLANHDSFDGCAGLDKVSSYGEWMDFENKTEENVWQWLCSLRGISRHSGRR